MIRLVIDGVPEAKQSVRFSKISTINGKKQVHSYQPKKLNDYTKKAKKYILSQLPEDFMTITKPVSISYRFLFNYTSDIAKKYRKDKLYRYKKPDIDNLQKAVNDVLNEFVIKDDALISQAIVSKEYAEKSQTILEINPIEENLWK